MLYKSPVYSQASGSVAGLVYSHNRGGNYVRLRKTPTNPNTQYQQAIRGYFAQLAERWSNVLTADQRYAWALYAAQVTVPNPLGDQIYLSGQQHYIRSNTPRLQASVAAIDDGPTTYNLGEFTPVTLTDADQSDNHFHINFTNTDDWATEVGAYLLAYQSRGLSPTIGFFRGPYRYTGKLAGAAQAPASPFVINSVFDLTAGQYLYARVRIARADGRLSAEQLLGPNTVVA